MERSAAAETKSIILTLAGNNYPNTILIYGPPESGKTVIVDSDLPNDKTIVMDTLSTYPVTSDKAVIQTTNVNTIISNMAPGHIIVVDDTFVLTANEIKLLFRAAIDMEAILILVSQIRKFREEKFYPYMESVVKNANIWLRVEPLENDIKKGKLVSLIVERIRGQWTYDLEQGRRIQIPIKIVNYKIDDEVYAIFNTLLGESKE